MEIERLLPNKLIQTFSRTLLLKEHLKHRTQAWQQVFLNTLNRDNNLTTTRPKTHSSTKVAEFNLMTTIMRMKFSRLIHCQELNSLIHKLQSPTILGIKNRLNKNQCHEEDRPREIQDYRIKLDLDKCLQFALLRQPSHRIPQKNANKSIVQWFEHNQNVINQTRSETSRSIVVTTKIDKTHKITFKRTSTISIMMVASTPSQAARKVMLMKHSKLQSLNQRDQLLNPFRILHKRHQLRIKLQMARNHLYLKVSL